MPTKREVCTERTGGTPLPDSSYAPETVRHGHVRASRMGKRRALVLLLVHLAIFAHLLHWQLAGETISPVEPSEAMYTIADGVVNAGFMLLGLSLLATLILGRWFCGWACHLVALQDLCAWMMKKVGIRPRPLKSRFLVFVPLAAGIYMFFWPQILRWMQGSPAPSAHLELTKSDFWETFPGFWVGALTFLCCGFVIVYLLGAKGFCTYACPYGGLFGVADRVALGRIRVTDACRKCGHCTAICTSNVQVAKEVHEYGMVIDPGCMKCCDCVSVCPENALYFGFGRPSLFAKKRVRRPRKLPLQFTWSEEIAMAAVFLVALLIFRGIPDLPDPSLVWAYDESELYGQVPLLFALGLSAMTAFLAVTWWRLLRRKTVSFQGVELAGEGHMKKAGWAALGVTTAALLFVVHSGWVQYHMFQGARMLEKTAVLGAAPWTPGWKGFEVVPPEVREATEASDRHYESASRLGLFSDVRIPKQRMWLALVKGDVGASESYVREAIALLPDWASLHHGLGRVLVLRGDFAGAERSFREAIRLDPTFVAPYEDLSGMLFLQGRLEDAHAVVRAWMEQAPHDLRPRGLHIACLELGGEPVEPALAELRVELASHVPPGEMQLRIGILLVEAGALQTAEKELRALANEQPRNASAAQWLGRALQIQGKEQEARIWLRRAQSLD